MRATESEHPFLLVTRDRFDELRARASASPWREMRESALQLASELGDDPNAEIGARARTVARAFSVGALAYILEPERSAEHRERLVSLISAFDSADPKSITRQMLANDDKTLWVYAVPTGNAYVQAILALDIIHDELAPDELLRVETILRDGPAAYFRDTELAWHQGAWAVRAMWALYQRDEDLYGGVVQEWRRDTLESISADGVFTGGVGYAAARWTNPDREHKALFGEILAHTGVLPDWHDEPRVRAFHEWFAGYAHTPFEVMWTFGDSGPGSFEADNRTGLSRAYAFSELAASYVAALVKDRALGAYLSTYVLSSLQVVEPAAAPSRIFPDGGAWLKQTSLDPESLAVVLHNLRDQRDAHAHKDTNAVAFAAYGELLLRGSGYTGWNTGDQGFSWDYIHSRAISANVALFDYQVPTDKQSEPTPSHRHDHMRTYGAGITDGILSGHLDYACGDSGDAMYNGRHLRNLLFVHPADGAAGYAVTIDQLVAGIPGVLAQVVWHPASPSVEASEDGTHSWRVRQSSEGVDLTVFLGTPPRTTTQHDGVLSAWGGGIVGRYLVGHYQTDERGRTAAVTVLFPRRDGQEQPLLARATGPQLTGATVLQGDVEDVVWEADPGAEVEPRAGVRVRARAGFLRHRASGQLLSLWVKDATLVDAGSFGFESERPLSVVQRGAVVQVSAAEPTRLTLRTPGLTEVLVDGLPVPAYAVSGDRRSVDLAAGSHVLVLAAEGAGS